MRTPPLLANFIYDRVCKLKCEKFLTLPVHFFVDIYIHSTRDLQTMSLFIYFSICETYSTLSLDSKSHTCRYRVKKERAYPTSVKTDRG